MTRKRHAPVTGRAQLEQKRPDFSTRILSEDEVALVDGAIRDAFGQRLWSLVEQAGVDVEDTIRFSAVARRCRMEREKRELSIKEVAATLRVRQYRIREVEEGSDRRDPEIVKRYIEMLKLTRWYRKWQAAQPEKS